jgi:hypothetical protein
MTATGGIGARRGDAHPPAAAFRRLNEKPARRDARAAGEPLAAPHRPEHAAGEPRAIATACGALTIALISAQRRAIRPPTTVQPRTLDVRRRIAPLPVKALIVPSV